MRKLIGAVTDFPDVLAEHTKFKLHAELPMKQIDKLQDKILKLRLDAYDAILVILKEKKKLPEDWNSETDGIVVNIDENVIFFERKDDSSKGFIEIIKDLT